MMELTVMSYPVEAIKGVNELSLFCSVHKINLLAHGNRLSYVHYSKKFTLSINVVNLLHDILMVWYFNTCLWIYL
jgi:hypothetical protein